MRDPAKEPHDELIPTPVPPDAKPTNVQMKNEMDTTIQLSRNTKIHAHVVSSEAL